MRGSGNSTTAQSFKYLIVIDFESTCWQDGKFRTQEIIEFPAVLLNTLTGDVESEFHHYVQPQEQPTLSAFCTDLTGITQCKVDDGIPINLCLKKFGHWLDRLYREKGVVCQGTATQSNTPVNTTCVTWSDWDLGVCLQYECKRKQLMKPVQLTSWIDLRATYRKFYDRKPNGLNGALQDLGIEFQGREHSGVDDARNTAKLAYRMIRDGCHMKVTKTLKNHERSVSCNPTITKYVAMATRKTPPRKAKEKCALGSPTTPLNRKTCNDPSKTSPSKIPVRVKTPRKSEIKKQSEATGCCVNSGTNIQPNNDSKNNATGQEVNLVSSHKRKHFTPVKKISKDTVQSPRRKIQRKFSPRKLKCSDIYVDPDSSTYSADSLDKVTDKKVSKGLSLQDSNVHNNTTKEGQNNFNKSNNSAGKSNSSCFKVPNPVIPSKVSGLATPNTRVSNCVSNKGCFSTSTPLNGNLNSKGFNSSKVVSPINQFTPYNGLTNSATISDSKSSLSTPSSCYQNSSNFRTLVCTPTFNGKDQCSGFATNSSGMKVTPPLCKCGRRSRRRMVQSPGQNMGRFFFSCTVRKRVGAKEGCDFFKWETSGVTGQSMSSSTMISKQFTPVMRGITPHTSGVSQKRSLGVRSYTSQKVYIR